MSPTCDAQSIAICRWRRVVNYATCVRSCESSRSLSPSNERARVKRAASWRQLAAPGEHAPGRIEGVERRMERPELSVAATKYARKAAEMCSGTQLTVHGAQGRETNLCYTAPFLCGYRSGPGTSERGSKKTGERACVNQQQRDQPKKKGV